MCPRVFDFANILNVCADPYADVHTAKNMLQVAKWKEFVLGCLLVKRSHIIFSLYFFVFFLCCSAKNKHRNSFSSSSSWFTAIGQQRYGALPQLTEKCGSGNAHAWNTRSTRTLNCSKNGTACTSAWLAQVRSSPWTRNRESMSEPLVWYQ